MVSIETFGIPFNSVRKNFPKLTETEDFFYMVLYPSHGTFKFI